MMEELSSAAAGASANPQDESSMTVDAAGMLIGDEEEGESMDDLQLLHAASHHQQQTAEDMLMVPLMMASEDSLVRSSKSDIKKVGLKARPSKQNATTFEPSPKGRRRGKRRKVGRTSTALQQGPKFKSPRWCPGQKSIQAFMNFLARLLFWGSVVATTAAVFWYSYELKNNGTDPHLIAWFSAGAFVLLGFPISMYCIVMHLANYNQPNEQMYIVRILWMIPIYSLESWLCLRFHHLAIYIETLRDCYESYVLYSFLQFLIQVLGGEQALVNMLKDKSPTRGVHMWGLQWCVKPWLMGQPTSRVVPAIDGGSRGQQRRMSKRVLWTSPFFVRCKFGVLQYVLLKFVLSVFVMILELNGLYKEGDFGLRSGYLYICILTNLSQCWALYCLIFFYYATKNELSPINPVGKFLSVKAIVFFTWWQSVCISIFYQMGVIPEYTIKEGAEWTSEDVAKGLQDYLICIEMFAAALVHTFVFPHTDYMPAAVAARQRTSQRHSHRKIRIGRLHNKSNPYSFLYTTSDRDDGSKNSNNLSGGYGGYDSSSGDLELASHSTTSETNDMGFTSPNSPLASPIRTPQPTPIALTEGIEDEEEEDDPDIGVDDSTDYDDEEEQSFVDGASDCGDGMGSTQSSVAGGDRPGFVRALIDSAIPKDVFDNTAAIVKGDYVVEKKTLLHHAATSDQYEIFSSRNYKSQPKKTDKEQR